MTTIYRTKNKRDHYNDELEVKGKTMRQRLGACLLTLSEGRFRGVIGIGFMFVIAASVEAIGFVTCLLTCPTFNYDAPSSLKIMWYSTLGILVCVGAVVGLLMLFNIKHIAICILDIFADIGKYALKFISNKLNNS